VDPNALIFCEGISEYPDASASGGYDTTWCGGDLQGVARYPVVLSSPEHVVYSAHDYCAGQLAEAVASRGDLVPLPGAGNGTRVHRVRRERHRDQRALQREHRVRDLGHDRVHRHRDRTVEPDGDLPIQC
jgi:hypothetical protein